MGIDSIDVLELVMMIEKDYGVKIESKELGIKVFASVRALATHIFKNQRKKVKRDTNSPSLANFVGSVVSFLNV